MKLQKGFIQIPILIAIIVGVLVISGGGYFGVKQYQNYQTELERQNREIEALKNKEPQIIKQTIVKEVPQSKTESDLSSIVQQWKSRIAYINCYFYYTGGGLSHVQSGSGIGLYNQIEQRISVVTNRHVVTSGDDWNSWTPDYCTSQFPDTDSRVYYTYTTNNDLRKHKNPNLDVAFLWSSSPSDTLKSTLLNNPELCEANKKALIGDKVVILGYPEIGSSEGITATEGIISGYDGDYYITSAKIEHGNSGGVAVLVKDNCYLGIPTLVAVGSIESLGRILDVNIIVP